MSKTKIEWADNETTCIIDAPGYKINKHGNILGPAGKILHPIQNKSGHLYIFIRHKKRFVHRLVLETFVGPCPPGMECRHLDGNPTNNAIDNLVWGTRLENAGDRKRHGRCPVPHKAKDTKLIPSDIPIIKHLSMCSMSTRKIGALFGTSHTTIQKILRGERWIGY